MKLRQGSLFRVPSPIGLAVCVLVGAACTPAYVNAPSTTFRSPVPQAQTFDALYRHALSSGYVMAGLTPHASTFSVQARLAGWRGRRRRSRAGTAPGMGDMFVVEVRENQVRIRVTGPHIREDGMMHPALADELESFRRSLEAASRAPPRSGLSSIPAAYGSATYGGYGRTVQAPGYGARSLRPNVSVYPPPRTAVTPASVYGTDTVGVPTSVPEPEPPAPTPSRALAQP